MDRDIFKNDGKLKIVKNDKDYILPDGWELDDVGNYDFSLKLQDKAFAHGSNATGDGCIKGRTIKVSFDLKESCEKAHDAVVNDALIAFSQRDYLLYAGRQDRYFRVAGVSKIKHKYQKGFKQRWSDIEIALLLADPFRYSTSSVLRKSVFDEEQEGAEISIYSNASVDVPLIFTFKPFEGQSMPEITIVHAESGESFKLRDTLLTAPALAVVNGETGTVRRDTANSLNTFSGLFLHAAPGRNTYKYTGSAGEVDIQFTERWFV